jgi:hypothetical protein
LFETASKKKEKRKKMHLTHIHIFLLDAHTTEGLFRVPGSLADIRRIKALYEKGKTKVDLTKESHGGI